MTVYSPSSAFLLVGGKDISGDTFQLASSVEQILTQSDGLGDSMEERLPVGKAKVSLTATGGFYDSRTAGINDAFELAGTTRQVVGYGFVGYAIGAEAVMIDGAFVAKYNRIATRDDLTRANGEYVVSGQLYRGIILHGLTAETTDPGSTQSSSVDNAASSAGGLTADLHVTALTLGGFTSLTCKVRHSTDNVTFADLITFTTVTAAGTTERKTVAGTVNRYLAMSWDFIGSGSGESAVPYVCAVRL